LESLLARDLVGEGFQKFVGAIVFLLANSGSEKKD
jgi:hypothetical protein